MADNMGVHNPHIMTYDPLTVAKNMVYDYVRRWLGETIPKDEVIVVWFSKTLGNWKALVTTSLPDGRYYEVSHNGENKDTYLDIYQKTDNVRFPLKDLVRYKG